MENHSGDISRFLNAIWRPGDVREIRAFDVRETVTYGYFDSPEIAAQAIEKIQSAHICYIVLNPCKPELLARAKNRLKQAGKKSPQTSDKDIAALRLLLIDLDPVRPAGISSSSVELAKAKEMAMRMLADLGKPLVFGMSGNGYHLIYPHDAEDAAQLAQYLGALQEKYGPASAIEIDVKCFNPSRITKVLGTWARKGDSTEDRPHRQSRILEIGENPVILHIPKIEVLEKPKPTAKATQPVVSQSSAPAFDVRAFLAEHGVIIKEEKPWNDCTMLVLENCIFDHNHQGKDSAVLIHPSGMLTYQCFHNSCQGRTWPEARELLAGPKPLPACKYCNQPISWSDDRKPLNPDGSRHICLKAPFSQEYKPYAQREGERVGAEVIEEAELEAPEKKEDVPLDWGKIHPVFDWYCKAIEPTTDAPIEYIAVALLASLAASIGNKAMLQVGHGIKPNLYCVLVGESTFHRKTTALNYGLAPLVRIDIEKQQEYLAAMDTYREDLEEWDQKTDPQGKPQEPRWNRLVYPSEITPEQLLVRMQDKPDSLFKHSELATLLAKMDAGYSAGFKELLTDLYDAPAFYDRETKSRGIARIQNAAPSLIAATTWTWLQRHLSEGDLLSGFLARFCFAVRRAYPVKTIAIPPFFREDEWSVGLFRKLARAERHWTLSLSPGAKEFYEAWYADHHAMAIQENKFLHGFLGRLEPVVHKVAIINHCLSHIDDLREVEHAEIEVESYQQAVPWVSYFEANIKGCFEELTGGEAIEQKIMEIIRKRGDEEGKIPQYKLIQYANMKKKDLMEYIETLEAKKFIRSLSKGKYRFYQIKRGK